MSFQSLNPELTAKVLFLANLQRNLMQNQNQNAANEKITEGSNIASTSVGHQQQIMHPLLMPSLNVSPQKISAMLAALTPSPIVNNSTSPTNPTPIHSSTSSLTTLNNNSRNGNSPANLRSNGASFGWGNRERKMEENWRMQSRNTQS